MLFRSCVAEYGQLIVDECHHLSAVSFEAVARQCQAKYVLGLTATPKRKDGQHPIIFMQCGPIRYYVDAKLQAEKRPFEHYVIPRHTKFRLSSAITEQYERPPIQAVYAELSHDETRNQMILDDVLYVLKPSGINRNSTSALYYLLKSGIPGDRCNEDACSLFLDRLRGAFGLRARQDGALDARLKQAG